ncbi:type II secretion system protein GspH [Pseudomonas umsongensis]|jgi:general secretion pathway protein H|uniref:Type II secretion system protein H n=2 Tax=Pseudomonas umsongensis TaxID=198618 RepID=A0AAE6ZS32_9PSED|nr:MULTISPECIES: type II secretion system minor pseudopilin GspH [Pseudomonas]KEX91482.1 general secretion pathway protein GspH [Pseudomonas putida]MBT9574092.1 type II secretion system minor pseudopilin GspH [Pseudomonas umsongensis]OXR30586.1 type II secretion system protein GspH [Pseudomonas umsongensis]QFG33582.1 type II secretion system protein GspH [Pseudomonas umsongensis]QJC77184.1 type II secretion system minor pseudopilin GspH [Pseudomonas umsongensis]
MPRRSRGFTLLEMMIVTVLIGVLLGMVSLATGIHPAQQARQEASALGGVIRQLRQQAVLEGREYGLRLSVLGYRSMRLDGRGWEPLAAFNRWPESLQLSLEQEGYALRLGADVGPPQILLYSSDETSNFTLTFAGKDKIWATLSGDGMGEIMIDE